MTLGQRVAVMRDGRIQQVDTPQELYARPANLFVAAFIGSPAMNLVEADVAHGQVRFGGYAIPLPAGDADACRTGRRGHPSRGVRGQRLRRAVAAAPGREGRGRRGARRGHARAVLRRRTAASRWARCAPPQATRTRRSERSRDRSSRPASTRRRLRGRAPAPTRSRPLALPLLRSGDRAPPRIRPRSRGRRHLSRTAVCDAFDVADRVAAKEAVHDTDDW